MSTTTRISYAQFDSLIRKGVFESSEERFELLLGDVCIMSHPKPRHEFVVAMLNQWSYRSLTDEAAWIWVQSTLGIPELDSLTIPDVAWMRRKDYSEDRPLAGDVLLVIEVSDTTLSRDRGKKARIYAGAEIADYWIVNLKARCLEIRRDPEGDVYQSVEVVHPGQEARPLAFPEVALPISHLFPEK